MLEESLVALHLNLTSTTPYRSLTDIPIINRFSKQLTESGLHETCWKSVSINDSFLKLIDPEDGIDEEIIRLFEIEINDYLLRMQEFSKLFNLKVRESEWLLQKKKLEFLAMQGKVSASFKQYSVYWFNQFTQTELLKIDESLPVEEFGPSTWRRKFVQISKNERHRKKYKNFFMMNTLFQGLKKGLLPVRIGALGDQLKSHQLDLSTPQSFAGDVSLVRELVCRVKKIFGLDVQADFTRRGGNKLHKVSHHSTVEATRAMGGTVGYLHNKVIRTLGSKYCGRFSTRLESLGPKVPCSLNDGFLKEKIHFSCKAVTHILSCSNQFLGMKIISSAKKAKHPYNFFDDNDIKEIRKEIDSRRQKKFFSSDVIEIRGYEMSNDDLFTVYDRDEYNYISRGSTVIPAVIFEPGKVRVITKPEVGLFAPLQDFQKFLRKRLFQHESEVFGLIGEAPTEEFLNRFSSQTNSKLALGSFSWVSGDFKSATDKLLQEISLQIVEEIFGFLQTAMPELYFRIIRSFCFNMVDGVLRLPPSNEWVKTLLNKGYDLCVISHQWRKLHNILDEVQQVNGQVMGNVLSFPILCIANLVSYWYADTCFYGRIRRFSELNPVRINGDDIVFGASPEFYSVWKDIVPRFGLIPSVGKNLFSSEFFQINSNIYLTKYLNDRSIKRTIIRDWGNDILGDSLGFNIYRPQDPVPVGLEFTKLIPLSPKKLGYINFGLITSRKKNECEIDYSLLCSKGSQSLSVNDEEKFSVPSWVLRIIQLPDIVSELLSMIPVTLDFQVIDLLQRHMKFFQEKLPRLPFKELWIEPRKQLAVPFLKRSYQRAFSSIRPSSEFLSNRKHVFGSALMNSLQVEFSELDVLRRYKSYNSNKLFNFCCSEPFHERKEDEVISIASLSTWVDTVALNKSAGCWDSIPYPADLTEFQTTRVEGLGLGEITVTPWGFEI